MVIFSDEELQRYSERFLCQLHHAADGIIERPFNRYDIFKALGVKGIGEGGIEQATDEIVQFLWNRDFIRTTENKEIKLSMYGLDEAERICR